MNILITGGYGFIGRHLARKLAEQHRITIIDSFDSQVHKSVQQVHELHKTFPYNVHCFRRNVVEKNVLDSFLSEIDVVIHLAAQVGVGQSMYQIDKYVMENCVGTARILESIQRSGVRKLIVASSMSIYGEGSMHQGVSENNTPKCESVYAVTKRDQEELCLSVGKSMGISTVALRFFNTYGPEQSLNNPYTGAIAIFASSLLNDNQPVIFEDGNQTRDFIHVEDIVRGIEKAIGKGISGTFNLGTGKATTIKRIAELLAFYLDKDIRPKITHKRRDGDIRHCFADTKKAKQELDFHSVIPIEYGIQKYCKWLVEQEKPEDKIDQAVKELEDNELLNS